MKIYPVTDAGEKTNKVIFFPYCLDDGHILCKTGML